MTCTDKNCPRCGTIRVRGSIIEGKVVSAKAKKTVIVERPIVKYIPKYERYARSKSKVAAHNPECVKAREGDIVKIGETRRISKSKSWVVLEVVKRGASS